MTTKFTVRRDALLDALNAVAVIVPLGSVLPVLTSVLIEQSDAGATVTGTDLNVTVRCSLPTMEAVVGARLAAPGNRLRRLLSRATADVVMIGQDAKGRTVVEDADETFTAALDAHPAEQFPEMSWACDVADTLTLPAGWWHSLSAQTLFAASAEESRPILNGVLIERANGRLRFVATDGHRLALAERVDSGLPDGEWIVPTRAMEMVRDLLRPDQPLAIGRAGNFLHVSDGTTALRLRLIEGPYPNYVKVLPGAEYPRQTVVNRGEFLDALRRAKVVASTVIHRAKLTISPTSILVAVDEPCIGTAVEQVEATTTGGDLIVGVNLKYLTQATARIPAERIVLSTKQPEDAIGIAAESASVITGQMLVMPLRIVD